MSGVNLVLPPYLWLYDSSVFVKDSSRKVDAFEYCIVISFPIVGCVLILTYVGSGCLVHFIRLPLICSQNTL